MEDELQRRLALKYKSTLLLPYDDIGTVRTGQKWFDRYMIYPWQVPGFVLAEA